MSVTQMSTSTTDQLELEVVDCHVCVCRLPVPVRDKANSDKVRIRLGVIALRVDFLILPTITMLTLPQELSGEQPCNSFLFNAHADPPTAT